MTFEIVASRNHDNVISHRRVAHAVRLILIVAGLIVLLMGSVWAFQGAGYILGSFMSNDPTWIYIGSGTAVVGLALVVLGVRAKPATKLGP